MSSYRIEEESSTPIFDVLLSLILIILFPIGIIYLIVKACNHAKDRKFQNAKNSATSTVNTVESMSAIEAAKGNGWLNQSDYDRLQKKRVRKLHRL